MFKWFVGSIIFFYSLKICNRFGVCHFTSYSINTFLRYFILPPCVNKSYFTRLELYTSLYIVRKYTIYMLDTLRSLSNFHRQKKNLACRVFRVQWWQPICQFHKVVAWIIGWTLNGSIWLESHSSRKAWQCPDHSCRHTKNVSMLVSISLLLINNKKDDYLRFCCLKGFIKLLPKVGKRYYCLHMFARIMQLLYSGFPSRCLFKHLF